MPTDVSQFVKGLSEANRLVAEVAVPAVEVFAEMVVGVAQNLAPVGGGSVTPKDPAPGTLAGSGTREPAQVDGSEISVRIGFNTAYAAVQHNREDFRHDVGQAHFLKDSMENMAPRFAAFVGGRIKAATGK